MQHTTIDLPDGALDLLKRLAEQNGRTADEIIREAIIEKLEDLEDLAAAEEVMRRREKEGSAGDITLDELSKKLGLDDHI